MPSPPRAIAIVVTVSCWVAVTAPSTRAEAADIAVFGVRSSSHLHPLAREGDCVHFELLGDGGAPPTGSSFVVGEAYRNELQGLLDQPGAIYLRARRTLGACEGRRPPPGFVYEASNGFLWRFAPGDGILRRVTIEDALRTGLARDEYALNILVGMIIHREATGGRFPECPSSGCTPQHVRLFRSLFPQIGRQLQLFAEGAISDSEASVDALTATAVRAFIAAGQPQPIQLSSSTVLGHQCESERGELLYGGDASEWSFRCDRAQGGPLEVDVDRRVIYLAVSGRCRALDPLMTNVVYVGRRGAYSDFIVYGRLPDELAFGEGDCVGSPNGYELAYERKLAEHVKTGRMTLISPRLAELHGVVRVRERYRRSATGSRFRLEEMVVTLVLHQPDLQGHTLSVASGPGVSCAARSDREARCQFLNGAGPEQASALVEGIVVNAPYSIDPVMRGPNRQPR